MAKKRVLIMAGGTGGHVYPGLAVANALRENGAEVHWLGTQFGIEAKLIPEKDFPIHYVNIMGIRGKGIKNALFAPYQLLRAILQSVKIIKAMQPTVILGMGGFVSGPGGIAAQLLGYPLIIHEQNAKPGTTNKWLAKVAKKVLQGFPNTFKPSNKIITTGNPVRTEMLHLSAPDARFTKFEKSQLNLLVLGGTLGATILNQTVPNALAELGDRVNIQVRHQCGEKHLAETRKCYERRGINAEIFSFIREMDKAYLWADVVLCRAGALTIAELCAVGVGAILVPFPFAIDDHQTLNAEYMQKHQAAYLIKQCDFNVNRLADLLKTLYAAPENYVSMAKAAYRLRQPDATDHVIKILGSV